ncbi:hypothetical protein DCAR_0729637 [Daucus carota subsp. sativus]|uniref:Uncharacterized protein n=1 Tax=Daucus carota subsp. sativus TaxID=79200 RepID=A0A164UCQ1_DAUCS|nr:PREDICTED: probable N-acetyltransferase HLS1 [Daucus carota subsp. sativus]WOH10174.1 hypothetical protein DCAR_0729637 [Daucus carota subsp. sativus]
MVEKGCSQVVVREYDEEKDCKKAVELERRCEVGPSAKLSLFTDLLGDPLCRIRNSPYFLMLVAEMEVDEGKKEIVGIVRGCIKTATCGKKLPRNAQSHHAHRPIYTKLAYILGLRVSPSHRRMRIGLQLVEKMEEWFRQKGAEYAYMATESDNEASINLFTKKCAYSKFRTPSILVQPVFAHKAHVSKRVSVIKLSPLEAESLYSRRFATTEFYPRDIGAILNNKLNLGTFVAISGNEEWAGVDRFLAEPPASWAVMSVWNCKDVYTLQVKGASMVRRGFCKTSRLLDRALPWLRLPSVPDLFRPFGFHFLYGLGGHGPLAVKLTKALCGFAHNMAKEYGCGVVATEVSGNEPLTLGIPHWKKLSCADLWCMKRLLEDYSDGDVGDWTKSEAGVSIFVDPREL